MPEFKRVHASDNPDPDKVERDREAKRQEIRKGMTARDGAELNRQQAQEARASVTDNNRDLIDQAARRGGGPAGLNTGPSDTVSADPHNPVSMAPLRGPDLRGRDDGTGRSPPQAAAVTSDQAPQRLPDVDRAAANRSEEAQQRAKDAQRTEQQARQDERAAMDASAKATAQIATGQGHTFGMDVGSARRQGDVPISQSFVHAPPLKGSQSQAGDKSESQRHGFNQDARKNSETV